jgi:hypothetical protein
LSTISPSFEVEGDQGDAWRKGVIQLQPTTKSFQVGFYNKYQNILFNLIILDRN